MRKNTIHCKSIHFGLYKGHAEDGRHVLHEAPKIGVSAESVETDRVAAWRMDLAREVCVEGTHELALVGLASLSAQARREPGHDIALRLREGDASWRLKEVLPFLVPVARGYATVVLLDHLHDPARVDESGGNVGLDEFLFELRG